jgi:hypothetical protein
VRVQDSAVFSVVVHQAASEAVHRQVTAVAKVDRQRVTAAAVVAAHLQDTGVVAKVDRQQGTAAAAVAEHLQDTGVVAKVDRQRVTAAAAEIGRAHV